MYTKSGTTLNSRLALLEERDKQLRIRMNRDSNIKTAAIIKGLCPDMCPEKERMLRDVRGMVATYEAVDGTNMKMDHNKAVKDYVRSSADQEEPLPHELRPEPVLTMTLDYLITQIMPKIDTGEEDNLGNWYDFCWYRLRSIRKDIIQQHLCDINTAEIVEKCARFHICCYDRLWGASKSIFDDKINSETLMNCLQTLMHMYEDLRKQGITCPNEAEFRAYLILLKLNSGFLLSEYQQYSALLQKSPQVRDAVLIHTAYSNNMYSTYFSLMKTTTYLNCCLMQRFLAHLRTKAMEIIVRAHCPPNKISRLSLNFIVQTLKFDSREDCIRFCESFGLVLAEDSFNFIVSRNDFFFPETLFVINNPSSIVVRKRVSVPKAVIGPLEKLPIYIPHEVHTSFNDDGTLKQGAIDAADQEEKLYRDIVERKLILKRGSLRFAKSAPELEKMEVMTPKLVAEPVSVSQDIEPMFEDISDEENDFLLDDNLENNSVSKEQIIEHTEYKEHLSENNSIISISSNSDSESEAKSPETSFNLSHKSGNVVPVSPVLSAVSPVPKHSSPAPICALIKPDVLNIKPVSPDKMLVSSDIKSVSPDSKPVSPLVKSISTDIKPAYPDKTQSIVNFKQPDITFKEPLFTFKKTSANVQPRASVTSKMTIQCSKKRRLAATVLSSLPSTSIPHWKTKYSPNKQKKVKDDPCFTKLKRIRTSEKMKKVSLRKYALLWRNKVEKLKKVSDKSLREYLFYWGTSGHSSPTQSGFRKRLNIKKKTGLVVLSILHTDIVNRIDPVTKKVGELLCNTLSEAALNFARTQGNVSLRQPVFWKLVFALPPALKGNFTFPDKLRNWSKAAFYADMKTKMGEVQYRISLQGVPIFVSVNVILGSKTFEEQCSNISAAIVIRANGWETVEETQQRCDKLISVADCKLPMAILTIGDKFESCNKLRYRDRLSYFCESSWNDTDKLIQIVLVLARYTYFQRIKVDSLGGVVSIMTEKLFDALHEDKYINDELYRKLCQPNSVIQLYNELINKIKKEITACFEANFYGTACEFEQYLKTTPVDFMQFPSQYKDVNFLDILKDHLEKIYLPKVKWPITNSKEVLSIFRDYCHNINCDHILSKLIRIINPPDSNDLENPLSQHLETVPWLHVVEYLVKEIIKEELFHFNIAYRECKLNELIDSHWWMATDVN
uniref:PCI domain-containing protein n=2 Tax=Rhodnius prolixus TaxID=13249 RepID=T1HD49_RHOPR